MIDTEPFELVERDGNQAVFRREFTVGNFSGTRFDVGIRRTVKVFTAEEIADTLGVEIPGGLRFVGYETDNRMRNRGKEAWTKKGGLLSIWILGMYKHGKKITTVIPFKQGDLGPKVNDSYFGKVPAGKLVVKDAVAYFSGDGTEADRLEIAKLLVLDDLGRGHLGRSWEAIGELLAARYDAELPTLISTNLALGQIAETDAHVADRLSEGLVIAMLGESRRELKP